MVLDPISEPVMIHFKDGSVLSGLLQSDLQSGKVIRFLPESSAHDRRAEQRLFIIKEVRVDEGRIQRTSDLSSRGLFVESLTVYSVGTILPVEMEFGNETLSLKARVVYTEPGIGMGLEFHRPSSGLRLKLAGILEREQAATSRFEVKDRRSAKERRSDRPESLRKYSRVRSRERRMPSVGIQTEIKLSDIKAVFFRNRFDVPGANGEEGIIEFRDGETLNGRFDDPSPESGGIFVEIGVAPDLFYRMFVVKSAIKSLEYL